MKIRIPASLFLWPTIFLAAATGALGSKAPVPGLALEWLPPAGDSLVLAVRVSLPAGWYINSNAPLDSFLVPTRIEAGAAPGVAGPVVEFGAPRWPEPVVEHSAAMAGDMSLFKESFEVRLAARGPLAGKKRAALPARPPRTRVTLHYQSCDGTMCWPPKSVSAVLEGGASRQE